MTASQPAERGAGLGIGRDGADHAGAQGLASGAIDAVISPRAPSVHGKGNVGWLFDDPTMAAINYYRRTSIFPIMHLVGVKHDLAERHPRLPAATLKAFTARRGC